MEFQVLNEKDLQEVDGGFWITYASVALIGTVGYMVWKNFN